jgi:hypothetical protein
MVKKDTEVEVTGITGPDQNCIPDVPPKASSSLSASTGLAATAAAACRRGVGGCEGARLGAGDLWKRLVGGRGAAAVPALALAQANS